MFGDRLRAYRKEHKFAKDVARRFFKMFQDWRKLNPTNDAVYIYVGSPEMAETMIRRSPLWVEFAAYQAVRAARSSLEAHQPPVPVQPCNCAACSAARASRLMDTRYDA